MTVIMRDGVLIPFRDLPLEERKEIIERSRANTPKITAEEADARSTDIALSLNAHPTIGTLTHIGWGGDVKEVTGRMSYLGYDYGRNSRTPTKGFRRAVYDFCFGYVSGFAVKDIIWYVLTRSLNYRKNPLYIKRWREQLASHEKV